MSSPADGLRSPSDEAPERVEPGLLTLLFGFLFCVGFPLLVTWLAPASWLLLSRSGDGPVNAEIYSCLLLVVPVGRTTIEAVGGVETSVTEGRAVERTRPRVGESRYGWTDDTGELLIRGAREEASVAVSPATLDSTRAKIEDFLRGRAEGRRILFTVSNWKVGFFLALPLCLLTLAWLVGTTLLILKRAAAALWAEG